MENIIPLPQINIEEWQFKIILVDTFTTRQELNKLYSDGWKFYYVVKTDTNDREYTIIKKI